MRLRRRFATAAFLPLLVLSLLFPSPAPAATRIPSLTARAAAVLDVSTGRILYSKNPHLRLPPASTTKVMTVVVALERMHPEKRIRISRNAVNATPSKAGLTLGAEYRVWDLVTAALVSSSNDAAVALAEGAAGSEIAFAGLMNAKAARLGMKGTRFVNASGLPDKKRKQYTTAYDLSTLMRHALRDKRIDERMGILEAEIRGSDGKTLKLKSHNKMLWRMPKFVKGKTGWTFASRHTFVGTNYEAKKRITFAMLSSTEPWTDIERLAAFGLWLHARSR